METIDQTLPTTLDSFLTVVMTTLGVLLIVCITTPWFLPTLVPITIVYICIMVSFTIAANQSA